MKTVKAMCTTALCGVLMAAYAAPAMARCKLEDRPEIPQTTDVTLEQIKTIKAQVDAYMDSANHYIGCQRFERKIEKAIEEMKLVAAEYNVMIMLYKDGLSDEDAAAIQLSGR